ncbi:helix-turn-helix domain-containing protein [Rhizobium sp. TRM95111]|uniref:helix-turn-helix domain-containing protein n=1 Tax=Rhizobium alarense TaxID=2846851 RepID=UPI001F46AA93|nr:helix-turn-helix domain-containing protein [Rhizobium alarense]MCF3642862.1 helix-turn-helix domain-containing protein [Rhizobium alarense]
MEAQAGDSRSRDPYGVEFSVIAVTGHAHYIDDQGDIAMASQIVHFAGLSDRDRKTASPLPKLVAGDRLELHVRHAGGKERTLSIPPSAAAAVEALLAHMLRGERVAVLAEDQELSPTEASAILGISRPLVVLRMDRGDLPFRYVGKHRRALLKDVLALKARLETRQAAMDALAEDTEDLIQTHGL